MISLTLLINGNNVVFNLVPGLEWLIPGLEGYICSTGVSCSNMVGPMQHGCVVWCCLILINYTTVFTILSNIC